MSDLPFFLPLRGEFDPGAGGLATGPGAGPVARFGVPLFRSVVHAVNSAQRPDADSR